MRMRASTLKLSYWGKLELREYEDVCLSLVLTTTKHSKLHVLTGTDARRYVLRWIRELFNEEVARR
jgi:hypothetical protein